MGAPVGRWRPRRASGPSLRRAGRRGSRRTTGISGLLVWPESGQRAEKRHRPTAPSRSRSVACRAVARKAPPPEGHVLRPAVSRLWPDSFTSRHRVRGVRIGLRSADRRGGPRELLRRRKLMPARFPELVAQPYIVDKVVNGGPLQLLIFPPRKGASGTTPRERAPAAPRPRGESLELRAVSDLGLIAPGHVVLDVGSHEGMFALCFATLTGPTGRVLSFDPFAHNTDLVELNAGLNGLTNVTATTAAVGAPGTTTAVDPRTSAVSTPAIRPATARQRLRGQSVVSSATVALDDYADLRPGFVKIDVEGYEGPVLRGAAARARAHAEPAHRVPPRVQPRTLWRQPRREPCARRLGPVRDVGAAKPSRGHDARAVAARRPVARRCDRLDPGARQAFLAAQPRRG